MTAPAAAAAAPAEEPNNNVSVVGVRLRRSGAVRSLLVFFRSTDPPISNHPRPAGILLVRFASPSRHSLTVEQWE